MQQKHTKANSITIQQEGQHGRDLGSPTSLMSKISFTNDKSKQMQTT
jgi:hypothetical protein